MRLKNYLEEIMRGAAIDKYRQRLADARIDNVLWLKLRNDGFDVPLESFAEENRREYLARFVTWNQINELVEFISKRRILPIEKLEWIKDDVRQINWLLDYVSKMWNVIFHPIPPSLFGKELLMAKIDFYELDLIYKVSAIERMRDDLNEYLKGDIIFKWFKCEEEAARCAYAWDWLVKHKPRETYGKDAITSHVELLRFYDMIGVNAAQKELDVKKIKKNWNQQKGRANQKDRKQYNFPLTHQALADLDKLAKRYEVSRPQIIEALIKMEAAQGYYLPQKVRKTLLY